MLHDNGIYDVTVTCTPGSLTDHYNPTNKTVNLSETVYSECSVAATAVANTLFYFSDDGLPVAMRMDDWKIAFAEQRAHGNDVWREPFVSLRLPNIYNLRRDPFERATTDAENYEKWADEHQFILIKAQNEFMQFMQTFENPPRQRPASFTVDQIFEKYSK